MKILYVVSTLGRSGPTNQLFNIVKYIPKKDCEIKIVCLSAEPKNSRKSDFLSIGVSVESRDYSRFEGLLKNKRYIRSVIKEFSPDVIHSQGIRGDSVLASLRNELTCSWILTARNFPYSDYPAKFGRFKGLLMAFKHCKVQRSCKNVVACSMSIADQLKSKKIQSHVIRNGADELQSTGDIKFSDFERPIFISVGSLISRKNMKFVLNEFASFKSSGGIGSLVVLGDGPEFESLKATAVSSVHFFGNVSNVGGYLSSSDVFVSASRAEGMPNTVLEAICAGLPCILSDIGPHCEIFNEAQECVSLFINDLKGALVDKMKAVELSNSIDEEVAKRFSASIMSSNYQSLYSTLVEKPN